MSDTPSSSQQEVFSFLLEPTSWPDGGTDVRVIETHGAYIFMCGDTVLKIKRAVRLAYFDFSTIERRRAFIAREYEINSVNAPGLYLGVVAITREANGRLEVGGPGAAVEWALAMRRFDQCEILSYAVDHGGLAKPVAVALADAVVASHSHAPVAPDADDRLGETAARVLDALLTCGDEAVSAIAAVLAPVLREAGRRSAGVRRERAAQGFMRRCHGDLHLGNVVMWQGTPVLFDALEFDEALATIDPLYDLAFVLMDLERHGARETANIVANRYLWRSGFERDLDGLIAMPFYLALRAAIRAMVALDRGRSIPDRSGDLAWHAVETLKLAIEMAAPQPPRLIVIAGLSGTGKTTLASGLAPLVGGAPGAIHLRTDLERKWLAGVGELERLPVSAYTPEASAAVFERVFNRARSTLAAGHSVVIDGVFALPDERLRAERVAMDLGVPFDGIWLEAGSGVMRARVSERTLDASDATPAIVDLQLALDTGPRNWPCLDSSGAPVQVLAAAAQRLGLRAIKE